MQGDDGTRQWRIMENKVKALLIKLRGERGIAMKLNKLVGRRIEKIRVAEFDSFGDGGAVEEAAELTLDGGEVVFLIATDPNSSDRFYAQLGLMSEISVGPDGDYRTQIDEWEEVK